MRLSNLLAQGVLLASAGLGSTDLPVWPVDSLVKVFPDDPVGKERAQAESWPVARGGHTSLQFAVRPEVPVEALRVRITLAGGLRADVRRVGYVPVRAKPPGSPVEELARLAPMKFPDPLLEGAVFQLKAQETAAFWITVSAPATTRPGTYQGHVDFQSGRHRAVRPPLRIQVTRAEVPSQRTLQVTNWFNLDEKEMGRFYDLGGNPERYWDLVGNIAQVIAGHRQNVILTPVLALSSARLDNGALSYDFTRLDRWIEIFRKAGAADVIEGGHIMDRASGYDSPLRVPVFVAENGAVRRESLEPGDPRVEAHLNSFLPALYAHLKQKGWLDRYEQHVLDEAHGAEPPVYLRVVGIVRKNLPGVPTVDAIDQTAGLLGDACDVWVPQLGRFDDTLEVIREHVKKGGQAWFYTCLYPQSRHLNRFIDYPLLKVRLLHWFNFRHDFTGFLHWGGNYWAADPFANTEPAIEDGKEVLPAGDAFITYPWREQNSIHSSIRLEAMMEGIEDYELLRALSARNPEKAQALVRKAIPGLTDYIRDIAEFRRLHAELLDSQ